MTDQEPKKLALIRILRILERESDVDHPLTQEDIARILEREYGIALERKAISRNLALLEEAGFDIESGRQGSYLCGRTFDDNELRLIIDSILASKHISARDSKSLIDRLCGLTSRHFKRRVKYIHTVDQWDKTQQRQLFYNIEIIDAAIEAGKMIECDYNHFGTDKKLHKSSFRRESPYQLILHNQHYYLMAYSTYWKHMSFLRVDRITNIRISERPLVPLRSIEGYERGIDYSVLTTALPYMFSDKPELIELEVDEEVVDQIVDWFGKDVRFSRDGDRLLATVRSSPMAMVFWAMQYAAYVTVLAPASIREKVAENLRKAAEKYDTLN
ncbi:MAG: WYL domain-containing transcriptional regulator [Clostridia bacterium]|nr:WYL domain-containing transcriptional regulator [Clostridia bacterium]